MKSLFSIAYDNFSSSRQKRPRLGGCKNHAENQRHHERAVARFVGGVGVDEATICTDKLSALTNGRKHRDVRVVASRTMTEFFHDERVV